MVAGTLPESCHFTHQWNLWHVFNSDGSLCSIRVHHPLKCLGSGFSYFTGIVFTRYNPHDCQNQQNLCKQQPAKKNDCSSAKIQTSIDIFLFPSIYIKSKIYLNQTFILKLLSTFISNSSFKSLAFHPLSFNFAESFFSSL